MTSSLPDCRIAVLRIHYRQHTEFPVRIRRIRLNDNALSGCFYLVTSNKKFLFSADMLPPKSTMSAIFVAITTFLFPLGVGEKISSYKESKKAVNKSQMDELNLHKNHFTAPDNTLIYH
jgi:hypothetical protein